MKLLLNFIHLMAMALAVGSIARADGRLLWATLRDGAPLQAPDRTEQTFIMTGLGALLLSGGTLVALGLWERPDFLLNPKLQAKLVFVALLVCNGVLLHGPVFKMLSQARPLSAWQRRELVLVAWGGATSHACWLICAWLGAARAWSYSVDFWSLLAGGAALWFVLLLLAVVTLRWLAAREGHGGHATRPDAAGRRA